MKRTRRTVLQTAGGLGAYAGLLVTGLGLPSSSRAGPMDAAFRTQGIAATLTAMGVEHAQESTAVRIDAADIAENGAVVPVIIASELPETDMMALLVDKNPNALAGTYEFLGGTAPKVTMRIKMGQSSDVVALVRSQGKYFIARKQIKVTLGGCGG